MLRNALSRSTRTLSRTTFVSTPSRISNVVSRPALLSVRLNSSDSGKAPKTPEQQAKKAALEARDNLQRDWDAKILSYEELLPKTQSPSPNAYLIDVREPDEVIQGMIPSAVNLPLSVLPAALNLPSADFKEKYSFSKPRKDQEVTFYCRSGMRSSTASDVAKRNGYTNILNYKGSWLEWTEKQGSKPSA